MRRHPAVAVVLGVLALGAAVALVQPRCASPAGETPPAATRPARKLPGPGVPTPPPRGAVMEPGVVAGTTGVELHLEAPLSLAGRVVDESGTPLAGARVTLVHQESSRYFESSTGGDGRFTFGPLPEGGYGLAVSSPGLLPEYLPSVGAGLLEEDVVLHPPRRLTGRVLEGDRPIAGAEVRVESTSHVTVTDGDGRFTFEPLAPGEYDVLAEHAGQHGFARAQLLEEGRDTEVTLRLGTLVFVEGTVRDEAGSPIPEARVVATPLLEVPLRQESTTGADGRFRLGPLAPGLHVLSADAEPYLEFEPQEVDVSASQAPMELVLRRAVALEGLVTDTEGQPLAGLVLEAWKMARPPRATGAGAREPPNARRPLAPDPEPGGAEDAEHFTADSGEDGRFLLELPEPGRYAVTTGGGRFLETRVEVDVPARDVRLTLRGGASVTGTVVDARGSPLSNVMLTLEEEAGGAPARTEPPGEEERSPAREEDGVPRYEPAEGDGRFTFAGVPPGPYTLKAELDLGGALHRASLPVEVKGTETVEVALRLDTGLSLSGIVVDSQGRPLADAEVEAFSVLPPGGSGGVGILPSTGRTGPDGRFTVHHLSPGNCLLAVSKPGYALEVPGSGEEPEGAAPQVTASAGATDVRLVLRYQGSLRGRVVREDGTPLSRFSIDGELLREPGGRFRVPVKQAGTTRWVFEAPGLMRAVREVKVAPGQDLDLGDVLLTEGREVRGRVVDAKTGAPVYEAVVRIDLEGEDPSGGEHPPLVQELTAPDGTFAPQRLESRPLVVGVMHHAYLPLRQPIGMGDEVLELRLSGGAQVEGTVRDREELDVPEGAVLEREVSPVGQPVPDGE